MTSALNYRWFFQIALTSSLFLAPFSAKATDFQLDTDNPYPNEDGLCALVEAIDNANDDAQTHADCPAGDGPDAITLASTIALDGAELFTASNPVFFDSGESGLPEINTDITLRQGTISRTGDLQFRFFVVQSTGVLRLEDVFLSNGRVSGDCETFSGGSFVGCGGAILVNQGSLELDRTYLLHNSAGESTGSDVPRGGAVMQIGGNLDASESRFIGNSAEFGGAIGAQAATGDFRDCQFEANTAVAGGGAIHSSFLSDVVISGSVFSHNHAGSALNSNSGGAIDNAGSSSQLTVINSRFIANSAPGGGAINNFNASKANIVNSTFIANGATFGGAIRSGGSGAVVNLISSTVSGNTAFRGAGLSNAEQSSGTLNILDSQIDGNDATSDGGGVFSAATLNISNSLVDDNSGHDGGGIAVGSAGNQVVTIEYSTLSNNRARFSGGGLYFEENPTQFPNDLDILGSTFNGNKAGEGGGLFAEVVDVSISASTFVDNSATQVGLGGGGGVHVRSFIVTGSLVDIKNSTFSGNNASQDGGGIYLNGSALDALISSTTISGNTADSANGGDGLHSLVATSRVEARDLILVGNGDRNCLQTDTFGFTDGGNNISSDSSCEFASVGPGTGDDVDPLINVLDNNGGLTPTHSLQSGSPAIDAGSGNCPATDQRGASRDIACDIGAFEAGAAWPVLSLSVDKELLFEADETVSVLSVTLDNSSANSQPVSVTVPIRVTGSASGMGFDYTLSIQNGLDAAPPGLTAPFSFNLAAGERSTLTATITVVDDLLFEEEESVMIEAGLNGFGGFSEGNAITLVIVSDDSNPITETAFKDGFDIYPPDPE